MPTKFISGETVLSEDFLNKIFGGEYPEGSEDPTNPLYAGHVHDGTHADGHAQKINLADHVVGELDGSMIADGSIPNSKLETPGGGGGASALGDLTDVSLSTPSVGEFLKFDGADWINAEVTVASALDDLTDVTINSATSGQVLKYNGLIWVNDSDTSISLHGDLSDLEWTASGHYGTASRIAAFDGDGDPTYLTVGTDVQAYDATLAGLASTTVGAADLYIYSTGADAFTTGTITSFGRSILDDVDGAAVRTTIGAEVSGAGASAVSGHEGAADPHTQYLEIDGSDAMSGNLSLGGNKITNLGSATTTSDAITYGQVISIINGLDWQNSIIEQLDTPPISPASGDRYLVIATATGAWTGQEEKIAVYNGSSWDFIIPSKGYTVHDDESGYDLLYDAAYPAGSWVNIGVSVDHASTLNKEWSASGHTGTVKTIAGFDSSGVAVNIPLWYDTAGASYIANTLEVTPATVFLDEVSFGSPGSEQGSITLGGTTYDALVKINDFGGARDACLILHRHSTSYDSALLFARSNSDTSSHAAVTSGQILGRIVFAGHDGTDYGRAAEIKASISTTPGSNDMPGKITFGTSSDGSQSATERWHIDHTGSFYPDSSNTYSLGKEGAAASTGWINTIYSSELSSVTAPTGGWAGISAFWAKNSTPTTPFFTDDTGTDYRLQYYDATLAGLASTTVGAADLLIYSTGSDAFATSTITTFGRSLIDDADASAARTTLGITASTSLGKAYMMSIRQFSM
jgi:hypothetical protein